MKPDSCFSLPSTLQKGKLRLWIYKTCFPSTSLETLPGPSSLSAPGGPPWTPRGRRKREGEEAQGRQGPWALGGEAQRAPLPRHHLATAIFLAAVPSPASVTQSRKGPLPHLLPPNLAFRPWVERPSSQPCDRHVPVEAAQEATANLEKMEASSGRPQEKGRRKGKKRSF